MNKSRILVIEDEPTLRDIYSAKLTAEGWEVMTAADGLDGLDKALSESPALILLDLILPLKDGFDVLHDLKQDPKTKDIPVIIMSNLGQDFEIKRGMALGADQFLIKTDITPDTLAEEVKKLLVRRPAG